MKLAAVRVGVGTQFVYDGEVLEVIVVRLRDLVVGKGITPKEEPDTLHWGYSPGRFHY